MCKQSLNPRSLLTTLMLFTWLGLGARLSEATFVTVGMPDAANNNFPLGSPLYQYDYQQIYTSSDFSNEVSISSVAFASIGVGIAETVGFTLSLSTTAFSSLQAPNTNFAANRGTDLLEVFSGTMNFTSLGNGTFDFVIPTLPFVYDPSRGDLLVDIDITSPSSRFISFEATNGSETSRVYYDTAGSGAVISNPEYGLVTQFNITPAAVPEPASLVLLGMGLTGAWGLRRVKASYRA